MSACAQEKLQGNIAALLGTNIKSKLNRQDKKWKAVLKPTWYSSFLDYLHHQRYLAVYKIRNDLIHNNTPVNSLPIATPLLSLLFR